VLSHKSGGKNEEAGKLRVVVFVLPSSVTHDEVLLSWKWLNICLPVGRSE